MQINSYEHFFQYGVYAVIPNSPYFQAGEESAVRFGVTLRFTDEEMKKRVSR